MPIGKLITLLESEDLTQRVQRLILKRIFQVLSLRHKVERVPRHFQRNRYTNPVSGEYRYNRRSGAWKAAKQRIMAVLGGDPLRPLYLTGGLYAAVTGSSRTVVTSTRWKWTARGDRPLPLAQRRELEALAPSEINEDADTAERLFVKLAAQPWARRRRRRGNG